MLTKKISNIRIAIMVANESEDVEIITPYDLWQRAGFIIELISVEKKNTIILQSGAKIYCNGTLDKTNLDQFNAIYLPGGKGHIKFKDEKYCEKLIKTLKKFAKEKSKWLLGMCAAPSIFGELGLLGESKVTVYPGFEKAVGANFENKPVVISGTFITGKSLAYSIQFALLVIEKLIDKKVANGVAKQILYEK